MPLHILQDSSPHQGKAVMLQRVYYHCVSKEKRKKKNEWTWVPSSTCRGIGSQRFVLKTSEKFRKMVMRTLYARQGKRHRCIE